MGLIKAGLGALTGELADQWKEYIYCDAMDSDTLMQKGVKRDNNRSSNTKGNDNIITNGSKVAVNEGQFMLIVENGKVVDFTSEAGAYIYDTGTEPSLFDTGFQGLKDSFKQVGKRFTYGGQPDNYQRVYYINSKEIMNNKIGIGDVPFRDSEFGFTVKIQGYGNYSYKITNPVMFYTNVCANVEYTFKKSAIDEQLKTEVQASIQPALGRIAQKGIAYDQLTLYTKDIAEELNTELSEDWTKLRGISVVSVAFSSITVNKESADKIAQFQESRVYTNPRMMGARLGSAQANAMEKAAENPNGTMSGFVGMGMAMNTGGGTNAAQMFAMGNNYDLNSWKCECGTINTGKFCSECGKPLSSPNSGWKCECGTENTGKFCSNCGKAKPKADRWTCECGTENTGKFCSNCGKPQQ